MENLKTFSYRNADITFSIGDITMINATEMARPFGKKTHDFLRLDSTISFREALVRSGKSRNVDTQVVIRQGGFNQGTWMIEDLAIEFARWLSPEFAIWCNDRVKELLTTGSVNIENLSRLQILEMALDAEKRALALQSKNQELLAENIRMKPRDEFVSIAYESTDTLTLRDVAKSLNLPYGGTTLAVKLREHGLFFKNQNRPRQEYMNIYFDLIQVKTPVGFKPQVRVTQRGLALIAKVLGVVAVQQQLNMQ